MKCSQILAALLACASLALVPAMSTRAAINGMSLGASYDSQQANITFRVYSSQATRMELYLYASGLGAEETATYVLSPIGNGVWSATVPVLSIQAAGLTGAVYYGYRAWGPNWPYSASWSKGSQTGFIADVDTNGNRFNPNKLLLDPYAREISQDLLNGSNQNGNVFASGAN
jgi:isoamylase